jgi:aryl-alcohol dehydrogenase-like predicted oxidoreductase
MSLLPYFPLAYGLLTGKYRRDEEAPAGSRLSAGTQAHRLQNADFDRVEALERYAEERGLSILDVALGGLAAQPTVGSVIAGATSAAQVESNVRAASWRPEGDDAEVLAGLNTARAPGMRHTSFTRD